MAWKLSIWFGYSSVCGSGGGDEGFASPALVEEVATKAAGNVRAQEILADGYTVVHDNVHHFFPVASITHIKLGEIIEEE